MLIRNNTITQEKFKKRPVFTISVIQRSNANDFQFAKWKCLPRMFMCFPAAKTIAFGGVATNKNGSKVNTQATWATGQRLLELLTDLVA